VSSWKDALPKKTIHDRVRSNTNKMKKAVTMVETLNQWKTTVRESVAIRESAANGSGATAATPPAYADGKKGGDGEPAKKDIVDSKEESE